MTQHAALFWLSLVSAGTLCLGNPLVTAPARAVEFADGRVAFVRSPRLLDAWATFRGIRVRNVKYYFTVAVPADAGEPLQTVTFAQKPNLETIEFLLEDTLAYTGPSRRRGEAVEIASVTQVEGGEIAVTLARPLEPGTTVTVGLVARRNPRYGGIYLFRVGALPRGEKPLELSLGNGRLTFVDDNFGRFGRY
ncbi:MAG: DUF2808 domain-containing protein [Cyanobacteria bacterium J06641_5]